MIWIFDFLWIRIKEIVGGIYGLLQPFLLMVTFFFLRLKVM